jgi:hypothetical protein
MWVGCLGKKKESKMISHNDPRFTHVYISANLCNQALTEINYLSGFVSTKEELNLLSVPPFSFYRVTLQYCYNSEYNKLLEEKSNRNFPESHIASIYNLNTFLNNTEKGFNEIYEQNLQLLSPISSSPFNIRQRRLRDKKFSHSDMDEINNPLKIEGLTDEEIIEGFEHLKLVYQIINNCASFFDFEFAARVPYNDNRTKNFIKFHSVYKKYYYKNYLKAMHEGFGLF